MATSNLLENAARIEEEYTCPLCGYSGNHSSPTFKQRRCGSCGHRDSAEAFRTTPQTDCPECGDNAPKTHETGHSDIHTCRSCYNQFEN